MGGMNFNSLEACKNHLDQFWKNGIIKLYRKWLNKMALTWLNGFVQIFK